MHFYLEVWNCDITHITSILWITYDLFVLFDFINLTQVHNFTVSAQDIFTVHGLSVFTVSFTGNLQVLMR